MATRPILNPSAWAGMFQKFGIPQPMQYQLNDTVQPVALVDSEVVLSQTVVPTLWGTPASAGELAVPAAGTRLADTGALPAGPWSFMVWGAVGDASNRLRVRRRNAADAADIWAFSFWGVTPASNLQVGPFRITMALNERLVVENVLIGGAGSIYQGSIWAVPG